MSGQDADPMNGLNPLQRALSRWDSEGGAGPDGPQESSKPFEGISYPENSPADVRALHVRMIALENLMIALFATISNEQIEKAREMAVYISSRPGFTPHPLTSHAAAHVTDLIERSARFRTT